MSGLEILILDGDSRQVLPFARSLKKKKHRVTLACPTRYCPGYFCRYVDRRLISPNILQDEQGFYEAMIDYLKKNRCDIILPLGDTTAHMLSYHKEQFSRFARTPVPDYDVFMRAADKYQTMAFCMNNNLPCPRTYNMEQEGLDAIIDKMQFPVMVKPRRGIGAIGLHRFETPQELRRHYNTITKKYGALLVQEFIPLSETQFQAEAFCDANSRMTVCMVIGKPRFFPVTGGTSTCNITIHRPDIVENVRKLLEGIKWQGSADVDLILDPRDNTPKILEINPRVTAGIKIGFAAGIDYADLQLRLALGEKIPVIKEYKLGVVLRNILMDLLWYRYSSPERRRTTKPNFWKFFGNNVHYQTYRPDDPMPLLGFFLSNIRKYTVPGVWSSKLGTDIQKT